MHGSSLQLGWWKNWEMTIGLVGGLAFGVAFWRVNRPAALGPRPPGRFSRALTRSGIHLWLPSFILLGGAYDGWCELSKEEATPTGYLWIFLLSVCLPLALRMRRRDARREASGGCGASLGTLLALVGMIVCAGCLVSVPAQWQPASTVLLTLYTVFIGASILLTAALRHRRQS
jgi:hypothetical protein